MLVGEESVYCVIWTTTPWSIAANRAVCYSPSLSYSLVRAQDMVLFFAFGPWHQ